MPGHGVSGKSEIEARDTCTVLDALIEEHDSVFLLMDTRKFYNHPLPNVLLFKFKYMLYLLFVV